MTIMSVYVRLYKHNSECTWHTGMKSTKHLNPFMDALSISACFMRRSSVVLRPQYNLRSSVTRGNEIPDTSQHLQITSASTHINIYTKLPFVAALSRELGNRITLFGYSPGLLGLVVGVVIQFAGPSALPRPQRSICLFVQLS